MQWEVFTGSKKDPENPKTVATMCYWAAVFYVTVLAFCTCQVSIHCLYSSSSANFNVFCSSEYTTALPKGETFSCSADE